MRNTSNLINRAPCVAIMLPMSVKTCRDIFQGVLAYASQNGPWAIQIVEGNVSEQQLMKIVKNSCTGFIGTVPDTKIKRELRRCGIPTVLTDAPPATGVIVCDNATLGKCAADFFLQRNFSNFAFVGDIHGVSFSEERRKSFVKRIRSAGHDCRSYEQLSSVAANDASLEQQRLGMWLKGLPKPMAVFVSNDVRGRHVLNACLYARISIPQEISILSCDNDELICENATTPLSSIQMTTTEAGYEAARFLDRLMRSHRPIPRKTSTITYSFRNVVSRSSTESLACTDKLVERAMNYMRLNLTTSFTIKNLSSFLSVSKRLLELRFRRATGRSPHQELLRMRLEYAKTRLTASNDTVEEIAHTCGFSTSNHLSTTFRRNFGMLPSRYRMTTTATVH